LNISDIDPAPSRPPIVQARARRTREKILAQARRAFAERGFEATNLTEHILTPAGVSVGSFYHQFTNKREVLLEIFSATITERHAGIRQQMATLQVDSFADCYRWIVNLLIDDVERNPEVWRIQWREHESPDPEIRRLALVGVDGWSDTALRLLDPFYPGDSPNKLVVAQMCVFLASGMIREYSHFEPAEQRARRAGLVDGCVAFAGAGVHRLLADQA
jgi:AcrR family transcriptional regulator